jgi:hypothetical protein
MSAHATNFDLVSHGQEAHVLRVRLESAAHVDFIVPDDTLLDLAAAIIRCAARKIVRQAVMREQGKEGETNLRRMAEIAQKTNMEAIR